MWKSVEPELRDAREKPGEKERATASFCIFETRKELEEIFYLAGFSLSELREGEAEYLREALLEETDGKVPLEKTRLWLLATELASFGDALRDAAVAFGGALETFLKKMSEKTAAVREPKEEAVCRLAGQYVDWRAKDLYPALERLSRAMARREPTAETRRYGLLCLLMRYYSIPMPTEDILKKASSAIYDGRLNNIKKDAGAILSIYEEAEKDFENGISSLREAVSAGNRNAAGLLLGKCGTAFFARQAQVSELQRKLIRS